MSQNNQLKILNDWTTTLNICVGIHPTLAGQGSFNELNEVRRLSTLLDLTRSNPTKPEQKY